MSEEFRSTFLFPTPNWCEGMARLVDFGNSLTMFNRSQAPEDPDVRAMTQDWLSVGDRIREAMSKFASHAPH